VELERDALLGKANQGGGAEGHGGTGLEQGSALDHGDVLLEDWLKRCLEKTTQGYGFWTVVRYRSNPQNLG
jgi:hypothetical protein